MASNLLAKKGRFLVGLIERRLLEGIIEKRTLFSSRVEGLCFGICSFKQLSDVETPTKILRTRTVSLLLMADGNRSGDGVFH